MALRRSILAVALCAAPLALAQDAPEKPDPPHELVAPEPIGETAVGPPRTLAVQTDKVSVTVKLVVDETGAVREVTLVSDPQPGYDEAVIEAARGFRFKPGTYDGKPVAVAVTFTHTFLPALTPPPPPRPPEPGAAPPRSILAGKLVERGTREDVEGAVISAKVGDREFVAAAGADGSFRLPLAGGRARITVKAPGYKTFVQREDVGGGEKLAVTYYMERERYDPYEIVVVGDERRREVSRVSLSGPEIQQVPGTFGDPYRVIPTLPGVATVMTLLPFPIVRGATPASTGLLLDGTRVPMLYHMLSGPSVVHPELFEEVQFYPGGAPVPYGGYTGGIVDGRTVRARRDDQRIDVDVNLLQSGGYVRQPVPLLDATVTAAARYGYPGGALSLADSAITLSYWDYQLRVDGGTATNGWTVFAFGARDELSSVPESADPMDPNPPKEPQLILGFHRLDLRGRHNTARFGGDYRLVTGYDHSISAGTDVSQLVVEPGARWRLTASDRLTVAAGLEGAVHRLDQGDSLSPLDELTVRELTRDLDSVTTGGGYLEALWRPTAALLIRPGIRSDTWYDGSDSKTGVDPRLTVRYRLATRSIENLDPESDASGLWLKASAGVYHQPPRFVLPLPGLDIMPLRYGLLRSIQTSLGVEVPLSSTASFTAEGFYNHLDPTVFDLAFNESAVNNAANTNLFPESSFPPETEVQELIDRLVQKQRGRAYGLELLLRRRAANGLFGWVSYTLSRSARRRDGAWAPYDFDRMHLLNLVAGLPLPRNWDVSLRLQYNSGKPATTTSGYNTARTDPTTRFDLRIDKRAVWNRWLLDFYVDVTNIAVLPEEVMPGAKLRYVLPTVGLRGRF